MMLEKTSGPYFEYHWPTQVVIITSIPAHCQGVCYLRQGSCVLANVHLSFLSKISQKVMCSFKEMLMKY